MKIPEIKLIPAPETPKAKAAVGFEWNNEVGFRHKLGGTPDSIHGVEFPNCKDCGKPMTFYAQIDSIGATYNLADCMVIHQFVCFDCFTVAAQLNQI